MGMGKPLRWCVRLQRTTREARAWPAPPQLCPATGSEPCVARDPACRRCDLGRQGLCWTGKAQTTGCTQGWTVRWGLRGVQPCLSR